MIHTYDKKGQWSLELSWWEKLEVTKLEDTMSLDDDDNDVAKDDDKETSNYVLGLTSWALRM